MSNPIEDAQNAYQSLVSQVSGLSGRLSQLQSQGILWNDPKYQQVQQQYNNLSSQLAPAYQLSKDTQNQVLGIIGSSGYSTMTQSTTQKQEAERQQNSYQNQLAAQGVSVTPIGNLLPAATYTPQQQYNRAAEQVVPNPQPTTPVNQANTIATFLQQAGFSQESARIAGDATARNTPSAYPTQYVPYGDRTQQELLKTRSAVDRVSGEIGYYQVPINPTTGLPRTGIYGLEGGGILIGGGSRNSAQSGMFTAGVAGTPDIRAQYNPDRYAPTANVPLAEIVRANPEKFSRLGAEAYFGQVAPLDGRTLTPDSQVSRYPAWTGNLANLVQQVAPSKSEYPGANIPWAIPLSSPDSMYMDTRGITGAAPSAYNRQASMDYTGPLFGMGSRAGIQNPTVEGPRLIIGGAEGTRYGESIVAKQDRLVGGNKVASVPIIQQMYPSTPEGVEAAMQSGAIKKPFVSGTVTQPTGDIEIPFTNIRLNIPGISNVIAYVTPATFVSGRASSITEVNPKKTGGVDYANVFIQPETQQPTRSLVEKVGNPTATTSINPDTSKLETTITQETRTTTLPEMKTVYGFTGVQQRSGYETFLDENYRSRIPSVATGEAALRVSSLANPVSAPSVVSSMILERVAPDKAAGSQYFEPLKGQYQLFYEKPETAVVSYALGGAFGLGTRGLSAVASRSETLTRVAPAVSSVGGKVLGGIYAGSVVYESTSGLKDISPEAAGRIRSRVVQEGLPMVSGFGAGYSLPETVVAAKAAVMASTPVVRAKMEVPQFIEESGTVKGVAKYAVYKASPITEVITSPIAKAKMEAPQFIEESGSTSKGIVEYAKYAATRGYKRFVEIPVKSFTQEIVPIMAGEIPGRTVPIESLGATTSKGGKSFSSGFGKTFPPATPPTGSTSRITTRVVGGKETSGLKSEPSFRSTGSEPSPTSKSSTAAYIGQRTDYRSAPRTTETPYRKMSSQTAIMSEELPMVEGMTRGRVEQLQTPRTQGVVEVVRPGLEFSQMTRAGSLLGVASLTGTTSASMQAQERMSGVARDVASGVISGVRQRSITEQMKEPAILRETSQARTPATDRLPDVIRTPTSERLPITETTPRSSTITTPMRLTTTITTPVKTPVRQPVTTTVPRPDVPLVPIPPIFPQLGVTSSGRGGGGQRTRVFSEYFRVGTGIGQIDIAPPRNTRRQATQQRSMPRSPINDAFASQARKKPRKMKF